MFVRIGLPFWRGETRIEEGAARVGKAWGVGCWILPGVAVDALGLATCGRADVGADMASKAAA